MESSSAYKGITPNKLDKYTSLIEHHHARIEQLKAMYETIHYARSNSLEIQDILKNKDPQTEFEKTKLKQKANEITELEKKMDKIVIELESIRRKQKSGNDDDYISLPTYGTTDTPDFTALKSLPAFDPDKKDPSLYDIWQLIVEFVQNCNLSEKGLRTILTSKLKGRALSTYLRIKSKSIKEIIILLKEEYGSFPTKELLEFEKDNFNRKENESIKGAMSRHDYITRQLYKDLPDDEISEIITRDGKIMLKRIVRPEILSELQREINRASDIGAPLTYEAMLEKAHFEEKLFIKVKAKSSKTKANPTTPSSPKQELCQAIHSMDLEEDEDEIEDNDYDIPPDRNYDIPDDRYSDEEDLDFWAERERYYNNNINKQFDEI